MILVIDVGNTNITFGVYESKKLVTTFRMTSRTMRTSDEYGTEILAMLQNNQIDRRKVGGAIIASVVPKVMHALIGAVVRYLHTEPLIVGSGIKTGIKITSENPKEIGPDRIVDVVAAYEKYGGPVLVLDFGTARLTTSLQRTEDSVSASPHPAFEFLQRRCGRIRRACRRLKLKSQIPFWRGKRFPVCRQVWFTDRSVRPNISSIRSKKRPVSQI